MSIPDRRLARREGSPVVEGTPGIFRTTMAWNAATMLCHFVMNKGALVALHHHPAAQNGYLISGRVKFRRGDGTTFDAVPGTGYCFAPDEEHGAEVLEQSEVIECFSPMREEYTEGHGRG
jgi:quercetin dioxygenase-like cupin family protein